MPFPATTGSSPSSVSTFVLAARAAATEESRRPPRPLGAVHALVRAEIAFEMQPRIIRMRAPCQILSTPPFLTLPSGVTAS